MTRAVLLVLAALAVACDSGPPPPFSVKDGFLRDSDGRALILHGANVSGKNKWAPYLDFQQAPDIARMATDWGMNGMRLVTVWAAIEPQKGVFDDAYLSALEERVAWAEAAGIFVVVDMHQDLYGEGFAGGDGAPKWTCDQTHYDAFVPTTPWFFGYLDPNVEACVDAFYTDDSLLTEFTAAWQKLAQKLAPHANVVGFDPLNEPNWGSQAINGFEQAELEPFYVRVVGAVRAVAPQWVAFIEPASSRNLGFPTQLTKFDFPNVVYAPHSYDNSAEQGMPFDPSHRAAILANAAALRSEADALGAGLWVGEWGGPSSLSGITDYLGDEWDAFGQVGAGCTYWDYSEGDGSYGLLNADGTDKTDMLAVVTRPYPQRVAGDSVQYAWDPTAHTLTVTYAPNRDIAAPTLIAVPPAFRPATVTCGDCTSDTADPGIRILTPPSGNTATIVVQTP
ncbi:MAG TPA: cellulase family glycosylhydrolase [Polyangiaceae bacterium]